MRDDVSYCKMDMSKEECPAWPDEAPLTFKLVLAKNKIN